MENIFIIYNNYFDFEKNKIVIGGIQTYITDLCVLFKSINYEISVIQFGCKTESTILNGCRVDEYAIRNSKSTKQIAEKLKKLTNDDDIIIFGTDYFVPKKVMFNRSIAIQHGVSWDVPIRTKKPLLRVMLGKMKLAYKTINRLENVKLTVCVDYNFLNWYRTQVSNSNNKMKVITNYTHILPIREKPLDSINIIFARRLVEYRGTRVFTNAVKIILKEYNHVNVTIAGTGPELEWMIQTLNEYKNVMFTDYEHTDSLKIHSKNHIAVVPTVGSEGTSLALLEAMSSQCAVVASNVGGMTNIIIDGYNGLIVDAGSEIELYNALKKLIDYEEFRNDISLKGYECVTKSFSYNKWAEKWKGVLKEI